MKTINFLSVFLMCLAVSASSFGGDASSAKLKIYAVYLSTNGDCTDPAEILNRPEGITVDMLKSPVLAEHDVAVGTYKCLILKISDVIKFTPKSDDGHCVAGEENTVDVCQASNQQSSKNILNGEKITCTDNTTTGDQVFVYISTDSFCETSNTNGCVESTFNAFAPPTKHGDKVNGIKLQDEIAVNGDTAGTFIFNLDGKIQDDGSTCDFEPPMMGYR